MMNSEEHLGRVRRICRALPETTEKLSHGEPTFFVRKKVYAMFANNHHNDGHIAVWIAAAPGVQAGLIHAWPQTFFRPPYVGVRGWLGIELTAIDDDELASHLREAWRLIAPKKLLGGPAPVTTSLSGQAGSPDCRSASKSTGRMRKSASRPR